MIQKRLGSPKVKYSYGPYNKSDKKEQWIRITEGCPHDCPFCYEPMELKVFRIPEIVRNKVKIMDMNLLCKYQALNIIKDLGTKRVNNKVVNYELICGIDFRFLNQAIANALKRNRFKRIRIAWDWTLKDQYMMKDSLKMLLKAGYRSDEIMVFMICNWKITYEENLKKLDFLKVWKVKACDCYYNNQTAPNIQPIDWTDKEIKSFRKKVREHNLLVRFGIFPNIKNRGGSHAKIL